MRDGNARASPGYQLHLADRDTVQGCSGSSTQGQHSDSVARATQRNTVTASKVGPGLSLSEERQGRAVSKILFLIRSLEGGGAERQLTLLANELGGRGYEVSIAVFYGGETFDRAVDPSRVRLVDLRKKSRWDVGVFGWRLVRLLHSEHPDVVYSYASAANLWAAATKWFVPHSMLVWGIRSSKSPADLLDWKLRLNDWFAALLSYFSTKIIVNFHRGLEDLSASGYSPAKLVYVPNGIDTQMFHADAEARRKQRREWGISDSEKLVGMVGRCDPKKDPVNFLKAAQLVAAQVSNVRFACIGYRSLRRRFELEAVSQELGVADKIVWVAARPSLREVYNALDVLCSPSHYGEGFPNVVGEAMACGIPSVVTDVGDSAFVVGDTGFVVPPLNPQALASALLECLTAPSNIGERARLRILTEFSVERLVDRTETALDLRPSGTASTRGARANWTVSPQLLAKTLHQRSFEAGSSDDPPLDR